MVEVLIEEMFGSDRSRPKDYRRAVVIDAGPKNKTNEDTLRSERRSALKKRLTEPTLLEMSSYPTNQELAPSSAQPYYFVLIFFEHGHIFGWSEGSSSPLTLHRRTKTRCHWGRRSAPKQPISQS